VGARLHRERGAFVLAAAGRHPAPESLDELPEECIAGDTDGPETMHERRQVQAGVRELVCRLPPRLREPVVLYWFEQMSVAEIARFPKRPDSTVRGQLKEAMRELRELVRARPAAPALVWTSLRPRSIISHRERSSGPTADGLGRPACIRPDH
jgi:DNA-directed RNA polymerase specialized sigma24 family protein